MYNNVWFTDRGSVFMLYHFSGLILFRNRFCAVQHTAADQDLPRRTQDRLVQLQPTGDVECGLPDRWGWSNQTLPLKSPMSLISTRQYSPLQHLSMWLKTCSVSFFSPSQDKKDLETNIWIKGSLWLDGNLWSWGRDINWHSSIW